MRSTRLPGKVLMPLPFPDGKPMIQWVVDQVRGQFPDSEPIVATSGRDEDDKLAGYCNRQGISCFRGDEENVLNRFITLAEQYQYDSVVRLTGDNPLLETEFMEDILEQHCREGSDYSYSEGLPLGMNLEIVSAKALLGLRQRKLTVPDREHVTWYIRRSDQYTKTLYRYQGDADIENLRLTVDYPSDFLVLSAILSLFGKGRRKGMDLVGYVRENYPWIFRVNAGNVQKKQFSNPADEMKAAATLLRRSEMNRAAELLEKHAS